MHNSCSHFSNGEATVVQLREKTLSPLEFYREASAAMRVARESNLKVIINDRVDIALALKADGVHIGQEDLPPEAARELLGPGVIIGISTHNLQQAILATKMPIDYIAIGPIFSTATKESPEPMVGLEGLAQVRQAVVDFPLVAIGGITSENRQDVLDAGADAVARNQRCLVFLTAGCSVDRTSFSIGSSRPFCTKTDYPCV
jgi:thiamine-phosphate pyrophosphorylase